MKRLILATLSSLSAFAFVTGFAASMTVNSTNLGADAAVVAACDDAVGVAFGLATGDVTQVAVVSLSDVAAACDGQSYHMELVDSTGTVLATETGTVAQVGGAQDVTLGTTVAAASVTGVNLTVTG